MQPRRDGRRRPPAAGPVDPAPGAATPEHRRPAGAGAGGGAGGRARRAALAGELFAPGVGAQAGPPTRPATGDRRSRPARPSAGGHSHGPGDRPLTERFTSVDPDAFGVPTGREEDWRFTPLARLRDLLEPVRAGRRADRRGGRAGRRSSVREVAGDRIGLDPAVGSVLAPADRVSALALQRVRRAHVVAVPKGTGLADPVLVTVRGGGEPAYGHLVVDVEPFAEAIGRARPRRLAPGSPTTSSSASATARR